jgi:hypothetical protein
MNCFTSVEINQLLHYDVQDAIREKLKSMLLKTETRETNKELARQRKNARAKEYQQQNREKINAYNNNYLKEKYKHDPEYREKVRLAKLRSDDRKRQAKAQTISASLNSV